MEDEDVRQSLDVILDVLVQFRAEDDRDPPPQEVAVEVRVGGGYAVRGDGEIRVSMQGAAGFGSRSCTGHCRSSDAAGRRARALRRGSRTMPGAARMPRGARQALSFSFGVMIYSSMS
ncbi:MAG: hypothetical protein QMD46_09440 [Methanomicrobiales archaeon]|nr:hypothetical protein [Methanomicrobiales archaeon]MDI6877256.1 hypothetical protein [Methanomicrobiales archaeon]